MTVMKLPSSVTMRQFQYWARLGLVFENSDMQLIRDPATRQQRLVPSQKPGSGNTRKITPEIFRKLEIMGRLRTAGFEAQLASYVANRAVYDGMTVISLPADGAELAVDMTRLLTDDLPEDLED